MSNDPKAWSDVLAERRKQHAQFGDSHDDMATRGQIRLAAGNYLGAVTYRNAGLDPHIQRDRGGVFTGWHAWPWDAEWWKPTDNRRDLVKAAALIIAEIERLDRAEGPEIAPKTPMIDAQTIVGQQYTWEPRKPHARAVVVVRSVVWDGTEWWINTAPIRDADGDTLGNEWSRFKEACDLAFDLKPGGDT